jgi:membrane associated rhomboid family serine protease
MTRVTQTERRQPIFNRQPVVSSVLGGLIVAAHLWRVFGDPADGAWLAEHFSVVPAAYENGFNQENLIALFAHVFVHADWLHLVFNMVLFFAVSGPVVARLSVGGGGAIRYLILFFVSALASAACYIVLNRGSDLGAIGASGAICGLFSAYLMGARFDWRASIRDPQVRSLGFWFLALNVGAAFVVRQFGIFPIAWEAHLGGFIAGLVLFPLLAPKAARLQGPWSQS